MENENDWIKAGQIASQVRDYARTIIKNESSLLEVTDLIEKKMFSLGGKTAFPPDLSINDIAAHYSCLTNETTVFKTGDLVKIDLGVHVNGAIADTACTICVDSTENKELIESSDKALKAAINILKPDLKVNEIGKVVDEVIQSYNFQPIRNLSGHGIDLFRIHTKPNIPNYDNRSNEVLTEDRVIAIEPFASTGIGLIHEGKPSEVYAIVNKRPTRSPVVREVLKFIETEYKTMPFAKRWIVKKFGPGKAQIALTTLERENILYQYPVLPEKSQGLVSQAEHSILIREKPILLTKSLE